MLIIFLKIFPSLMVSSYNKISLNIMPALSNHEFSIRFDSIGFNLTYIYKKKIEQEITEYIFEMIGKSTIFAYIESILKR